MFSGDKTKLVS